MCGIVGYVGKDNAVSILIEGLKALEYRGYDSSGIAFIEKENIKIYKKCGKVNVLEESIPKKVFSNIGIGHTRWATHGGPSDKNSHPHQVGKITLVHNGIIDNYLALKQEILKSGYVFKSDTDTEVVAAMLNIWYEEEKDMLNVMLRCKKELQGSYALGVICDDEQNKIYGIRNESPLIVGITKDGLFIASDVPAILKYTNKYQILENNDIVILDDKVTIYNKDGIEAQKDILTFEGNYESATKAGYDHFMLKEINEQPSVIKKLIEMYIEADKLKEIPDLSNYEEVDIVACGSAYHAGLVGKYFLEKNSNLRVNVDIASEYVYRPIHSTNKKLVIIISQSGETADTLACLRMAKKENLPILSIVNVVGSSIARESDMVVYTNAGPEIAVATTKAFCAQIFILYLLSLQYEKEILIHEIKKVPELIDKQVKTSYKNIAETIYKHEHLFFIGRSIDYAMCMEGSLKLKECSYLHSESYPAGELKHGTISLIDEGTPVIAVITEKRTAAKTIGSIKEVKARGSYVILIVTNDLDEEGDYYDQKIVIPKNNSIDALTVLIPLQLIAYEVAKLRNCDIDKPKNLAKSVTV